MKPKLDRTSTLTRLHWPVLGVVLIALAAGIAFTFWTARTEGARMRAQLLSQARLAQSAVNWRRIANLSGTEKDLVSPDYLRLKEQLTRMRAAHAQCRFLHVMGRKTDGTVFSFVDSEPPESPDYSPPGHVHAEVSDVSRQVFVTGQEATEGPIADHWGTWISGFVPVVDPATKRCVAVLCMDMDAADWTGQIARHCATPIAVTFLFVVLLTALIFLHSRDLREKRHEEAAEGRYRALFEGASDAVMIMDADRFTDCNAATLTMFGYASKAEFTALHPADVSPPHQPDGADSRTAADQHIASALAHGTERFEWTHRRHNGEEFPAEVWLTALQMDARRVLQATVRDITDRKRAQEMLRENARILSESQRLGHIGSWFFEGTGRMVWSEELYHVFGVSPDTFIPTRESLISLIVPGDRPAMETWLAACAAGEKPEALEFRITMPDGSTRFIRGYGEAVHDAEKKLIYMAGTGQDITDRKQRELYLDMRRETLQILNGPGDLQDSIHRVLATLKTRTGFDAVGIRLQEGDDFPYFAQKGFSSDFLLTENTLVEHTADGGVCRDKDGKAKLECTCGLVISGKTDPTHPLFTRGGSFWTNDSLPLLDLPAEKDPRNRPRNQCIHQGYASVALVPIRDKDRIVGLIHLNDRRKGRLSIETVELLEGIASHIGEAMMRKRAEEALRENEEQLRLALTATHTVAFVQELDSGAITEVGPVAEVFGRPPGFRHADQSSLIEDIHPDDRAHVIDALQAAAETGSDGYFVEFRVPLADGGVRWVQGSGRFDRDSEGRPVHLRGTARDITERKQVYEKLRKSEEQFKMLSEHSPIGISLVRPDMTYEYANPFFTQMFGYSIDDTVDRNAWYEKAYPDPVYREKIRAAWMADFAEHDGFRRMQQETLTVRCRDGTDKMIRVNGVVLPDNRVLMTHEDVTQLANAQKALQTAKDTAEGATRTKSQFLANMSHEIRTPLNGIIGMTGLLINTDLTAEQRGYAQTVRTSGEILLSLITDILDFSKIEALKMELEQQSFNLTQCVEEALDLIAAKAAEKRIALDHLIEDIPPDYIGDVTRLRQILVNLLGNAIKFTDHGEVLLSVSGQIRDHDQYQLHFSIRDSGIGIPLKDLDHLFQSFKQVDASTTRKFGGTGLGLAISKQLAELMGGTMWVESAGVPGQGATFHFTIIAKKSTAPGANQNEPRDLTHLAGKRILIVDDNPTGRNILVGQTTGWTLVPTAVASGREALERLRTGEHYDVAILDLQMPEMDGPMLAEEIRRMPTREKIPLILLSSIGDQVPVAPLVRFSAFLMKPVKASSLFEALCSAMGGHVMPVKELGRRHPSYDPDMGRRHPP